MKQCGSPHEYNCHCMTSRPAHGFIWVVAILNAFTYIVAVRNTPRAQGSCTSVVLPNPPADKASLQAKDQRNIWAMLIPILFLCGEEDYYEL